jgi:hypothetical protein
VTGPQKLVSFPDGNEVSTMIEPSRKGMPKKMSVMREITASSQPP